VLNAPDKCQNISAMRCDEMTMVLK